MLNLMAILAKSIQQLAQRAPCVSCFPPQADVMCVTAMG